MHSLCQFLNVHVNDVNIYFINWNWNLKKCWSDKHHAQTYVIIVLYLLCVSWMTTGEQTGDITKMTPVWVLTCAVRNLFVYMKISWKDTLHTNSYDGCITQQSPLWLQEKCVPRHIFSLKHVRHMWPMLVLTWHFWIP